MSNLEMRLYIVHLGYCDPEMGGIYEAHTNILVAAPNAFDAKKIVQQRAIYINKNMHIDGMQEISTVDGYDVRLLRNEKVDTKISALDYDAVEQLI